MQKNSFIVLLSLLLVKIEQGTFKLQPFSSGVKVRHYLLFTAWLLFFLLLVWLITLRLLRLCELIMFHWLVCDVGEATWPSQMSMSWTVSLLALSLLCSSLPSKYIQGQQCSQGIGWPQVSLANRAMSTPLINRAASWTPQGSRLFICGKETYTYKMSNWEEKKTALSPTCQWAFAILKCKAKHSEKM